MNIPLITAVFILSAAIVFLGVHLAQRISNPRLIAAFVLLLFLFAVMFLARYFHWIPADVVILPLSISAGSVIGRMIQSWQALVVFCITLAVMDLASFYFGPTASLVSNYRHGNSLPLQYLSISIPLGNQIQPIVGIGDMMALASTYAALLQLDYPKVWVFPVPLAGLLIALAVGLAAGGISALPFMAGAVIVFVFADDQMKHRGGRQEK